MILSRYSTDRTFNNLPIQLTSFIGREKEIAEIERLLATTRLLTLTGAGGCGKTRLALAVAAAVLDEFDDGVWFIDLAPLSDHALVLPAVASALGLTEAAGRPMIEILLDYVRGRKLLLLLDNCEHLITPCAQMADQLLRASSQLQILATSREPLGIAGETTLRVPSLALPDPNAKDLRDFTQSEAVRLFTDRASAVLPAFQLTTTNASFVAQICNRLDGIPLAIELAAARASALSVEEIASRLDDQFRLLTIGSRTATSRHQTLRAMVDWSYALTTEPDRILLRRLSVFAGGWTLEAAEGVGAGDGIEAHHVLDLTTHLVDKSLVIAEERNGPTRYRMLETIRQYACAKLLESGEDEAIRDRHLEFFLQLSEEARPRLEKGDQSALDSLERDRDNLIAAIEWSLSSHKPSLGLRLTTALHWYWNLRAHQSEGIDRLRRILALDDAQERTSIHASALNSLAEMLCRQGDLAKAEKLFEEALAISRDLSDQLNISFSLRTLGRFLSDYRVKDEESKAMVEQALKISRGLDDKRGIMYSLFTLGDMALNNKDYDRAQTLFEEGIHVAREEQDINLLSSMLRRLGQGKLFQGDIARARDLCLESLTLNWQVRDKQAVAACFAALAAVAMAKGKTRVAAELFGAADAVVEAIRTEILPYDLEQYHYNSSVLHTQLDEATFTASWNEGRARTLEQAVAKAEQLAITELADTAATTMPGVPSYPAGMTEREVEVLRWLARGLSNQEIADKLVVSRRTVDAHLRSIYGKLGVTTRNGATRVAIENKII